MGSKYAIMDKELSMLCNKDELTSEEKIKLVEAANKLNDYNAVGEKIASILMDPDVSTYDMMEEIASAYTADKSDDFRAGFDKACTILTWFSAAGIAKEILKEVA